MMAAKTHIDRDRAKNARGRLSAPLSAVNFRAMKGMVIAGALVWWAGAAAARSPAPLHDPVTLNIGLSCQWQERCISVQKKAMKRALKYVKNTQPPSWRIHLCNRNASRKRNRVDWVGFNNCIRNAELRPVPPSRTRKRGRSAS